MIFKKRFPHTLQLEHKDCGPACLQMLCKHYGIFYEMDYLREITGTRKEGISVYDFIKASEVIGFKSLAFRLSYYKFRKEAPLPCVIYWKNNHFIVVYRITKKHIYVSDPAIGLIKYTYKHFANGWLGHTNEVSSGKRGVCILVEPTDTFYKPETERVQRKTSYIDALSFIWNYIKPYKKSVWHILIVLLIITLVNALFPIITQSIIDVGIPAKDYNFINLMLISSIVLGVSILLGTWIKQLINMHFGSRIKVSMLSDYIIKLFRLPLSFFESRLMGDLLQRSYDFDRIEALIMGAGFNAVLAILYFGVFGTILYIYNSTLFWIFFIANILYVGWVLLFWSIRKKMDIRYFSYIANNHSHWIELLTKISDIKSYNYGQQKRWQWEKVQVNLYKTKLKLLHVEQIQNVGSNLITSIKDALLIFVAALAVIEGSMTIGMMIAVQYILGQLRMPMDNIINFIIASQMSYISFMRISEVKKVNSENNEYTENNKILDFNQNLYLNNIYFKYSINDRYILHNVTLCLPKGKTIALVGQSGSGKSTIIKLLMQLYTPNNGDLSLGRLKLSAFPIDMWREHCGILSQESDLLKDTVLNNIVFGREYNKDSLIKAVTIANIRDEIETMPAGYNTMLGENGRGVSEGQKQRILFARAIYNEPDFLFLDEVTSSLDSMNENSIMSSIKEHFNEKTIVIAAHRLSSVIDADLIYVLKDGVIVESGNHKTLMVQKKEYYNLFKNQLNTRIINESKNKTLSRI